MQTWNDTNTPQDRFVSSDEIVISSNTHNIVKADYVPRDWQQRLHATMTRFFVAVLHRRAGKSILAINHMIHHAQKNKLKNPQYAYIAPTFGAVKRIAWKYMHEYTAHIPGIVYNETELKVVFPHNNAVIWLLSGENYNAIRGIYLDGCVMDETADMSPLVWQEAVRPTLSDRRGWCLFLGTPRGKNHFKDLYDYGASKQNPEWGSLMLKASDSGILPQSELRSAQDTMDVATYMQEYECSFSSGMIGAYFAKEMEQARVDGRITDVPYNPGLPVLTAWDLGINDVTSIWFVQQHGPRYHCIDYMEHSGASLEDTVRLLKQKPYVYDEFLLPHDANVRDLSTGKSRKQFLYNLGCRPIRVIPRVGTKFESISAARSFIKMCWFDTKKTARGIDCLEGYTKRWDAKTQSFADSPLHNWASNGADGFQQLAMGARQAHKGSLSSRLTYVDGEFVRTDTQLVADMYYDKFGGY